ncbi:hypothetical protein [Pelobacter seleniigenes]|uniref:hypothetical protein n=1 Tax=Pelobacter seleniigenes TaxID=407188 RepID=UPI0004A73B31|nr:hypothetical protein [Pelobacter seleniigenes]
MNILLLRPLITIRNHNSFKERLNGKKKPESLKKIFLKSIKNISLIEINTRAVVFSGKGNGPAFKREREYLHSILPEVVFCSTQSKKNFFKRSLLTLSLLVYILPLLPRLLRLLKSFRNNKRITDLDRGKFFLFLIDFLAYQYFFTIKGVKPKGVIAHALLSPRGLSLITAAIKERIPSIFILHGACTPFTPDISYPTFPVDLHLLKSQASYDRIGIEADLAKRIVFYGLPGNEAPLRSPPKTINRFGICLPYAVVLRDLNSLLDHVWETFSPGNIVIRFHPRDPLGKTYRRENVQISPKGETIQGFAESCDLIIAGNTSAILDILKIGCPVIYVANLDSFGWDVYGFVKVGLVPGFSAFENITLRELGIVYLDNEWQNKMIYFDSSYGKSRQAINDGVKSEILSLIAKQPCD